MTVRRKTPSFAFALFTLLSVAVIIAGGMIFFNLHLALLMLTGWVIAALCGRWLGFGFGELEVGAFELIQKAMGACLILICVGTLIGAWISAGTVPVMIYAGLKIIMPSLFLVTSLVVCSLTSLATGTSWGTIGTVGVALMGIGAGLGFEPGLTAATIICGAFFGDKMSPLSDTTNMAAAVCGVPLFRHIRHMFFTIAPAYLITFALYGILGWQHSGEIAANAGQLNSILNGLSSHFRLGLIPALPMFLVLALLLRQGNPIMAIMAGSFAGVAVAVFYQGMDLNVAFNSMWGGYKGELNDVFLEKLLNRGGITSMLNILCIVILACGLGGMLRRMGVIDAALDPLARRANTGVKLVGATLVIGYGTLMLTAAIYFSIVMTGTLMAPLFRKNGYRPENCSRVVEDASTLGGPLVPWANNALFPMATLSVAYAEYIPYVFLLYLTPLISLGYALCNITMTRLTPKEMAAEREQAAPMREKPADAARV